jgi:hypothetical protein
MINLPYSTSNKWILIVAYHFTRWIEEIALRDVIAASILEFLDGIMARFGAPSTIIFDNTKVFVVTKSNIGKLGMIYT